MKQKLGLRFPWYWKCTLLKDESSQYPGKAVNQLDLIEWRQVNQMNLDPSPHSGPGMAEKVEEVVGKNHGLGWVGRFEREMCHMINNL